MSCIVFDIETLAYPLEHFDDVQKEYLFKFTKTDEERESEKLKLNLSALTAQIIAIGMYNPDSNAGKVLYQSTTPEQFFSEDGRIEYISGNEEHLLRIFWEDVQWYDQFVTFNGRAFDCPFIMLRSAILGIAATRNLAPYRYKADEHCDLLDQLTFYNASRKFNLDFYCKAFGIASPKAGGITGLDLGPLFREGRFREIADYCIGDVIATGELFKRWREFLNMKD